MGQAYCRAVQAAGGLPVIIPLTDDLALIEATVQALAGLLLAGGGDVDPAAYGEEPLPGVAGIDPLRDRLELWLSRRALDADLPLLAICRGVQVLNVASGGTLYQDVVSQHPGAIRHSFRSEHPRSYLGHSVSIERHTRLAGILGEGSVPVNSLHHQAVKTVAPGLRAVASAPDGIVEALEHPGHRFAIGVQWHPEELIEQDVRMLRLFVAFVEACSSGTNLG